jgi:glucosylceramidase
MMGGAAISVVMSISLTLHAAAEVSWWLSTQDLSNALTLQDPLRFGEAITADAQRIVIDEHKTYQSIVGLGSSLDHTTCHNISLLPKAEQEALIERIVDPDKGIGMNIMRICVGTADFTASPWYTYHDVPDGARDSNLTEFTIEKDRDYVLPILKMALEKNPDLLFQASPWSPPGWMTSNDRIGGGRMREETFEAYAKYFVKFIRAYEAEGIPIYAITVQNEPHYAPRSYPTCRWTGEQQRDFVRDHLGPAFAREEIGTKIWVWDHNFNNIEFATTILEDSQAAQYVDGTAFHLYEGEPEAMSRLHEAFPDKHLYFTEGSTFGADGAVEIISYLRNWSRTYNAWVTIIDSDLGPNPGPHHCSPTCIMIDADSHELTYRFDYYMYGQFMKFISRGAVRIGSNETGVANVAFKNPDGSIVVVAANGETEPREVALTYRGRTATTSLGAKSVATFRWTP